MCAAHLEGSGLAIEHEKFDFSEFPGRFAVPLIGLILAAVVSLTVHVFWSHGGAAPAIGTLVAGSLIVVMASRWLTRRGTSRVPWLRSHSVNLIARRGNPSIWLVAHIDSKSQTIPMLARIASIVVSVLAIVIMAASLVSSWLATSKGDLDWSQIEWLIASALVALFAATPLIVCLTGNRSPGAADNASGVISVLLAARALSQRPDVGVVITSGEELGLAGARAFVQSHATNAIALNCDTIDDVGEFRCMASGPRGAATAAVGRAASRLAFNVPIRALLPGILADSVAFADAGWDSVTLSRGNLATLARVHTSSDTRERLNGTGIAKAARLLAATVEELS
jgi:hypothetical protein